MGTNSAIEWTHHTFNPWRGCVKVSPACANCYAEVWAKRAGLKDIWGADAKRAHAAEAYWKKPLTWNDEAVSDGERRRVFCSSLADVFEDRIDLESERLRLFNVIWCTPGLDWLLLTKRPENILRMVPPQWLQGSWPYNVWIGATVENQEWADKRIPHLLKVPAAVRFLSVEPMLGPISLRKWILQTACDDCTQRVMDSENNHLHGRCRCGCHPEIGIDWVICGGESGTKARPMSPAWARSLRDQCQKAGVAFHFKQWGEWAPFTWVIENGYSTRKPLEDGKMARIGKARAGRVLDGRTWDEFPKVRV